MSTTLSNGRADILAIAQRYFDRGFAPIPVPFKTKNPGFEGWQTCRLARDELADRFKGKLNIGVLLGVQSGGLIDVDLDLPEAIELADEYLPPTDAEFGRKSKPRSHRLYRVAQPPKTEQFKLPQPDGRMIVEFRSTGGHTVFPGSVHESGERIEWMRDGKPTFVDVADLLGSLRELADAVKRKLGFATEEKSKPARSSAPTGPAASNIIERARKYLAKVPPAISKKGGHAQTIYAAGKLIRGFALDREQALGLLREWNQTNEPPWTEKELEHKVDDAIKHPGIRGYLLNRNEIIDHKSHVAKPAEEQESVISKITNAVAVEIASETADSETKIILEPLTMPVVLGLIRSETDDWPRRMGPAMFVPGGQDGVSWLESDAAFFGYLSHRTGCIKWHKCLGAPTKSEVYAEWHRGATVYQAVESLPHYPPLPDTYYACREYQPGHGSALRGLLDRFNPATEIDRDLIQAALMTVFWGGPPGSRPAFLFTADEGRGKGKTTVAQKIVGIAGGAPDVSPNEKMEDIKKRFLNGVGRTKRCGLLDNVKTHRFSWAELESFITSEAISGWMMYHGDGARPNTITWLLTLNGASLSTDLAQRCVIVKVGGPTYSGEWESELDAYIDAHREAIISDCLGALMAQPTPLAKYSRWGTWEREVLSRLPEPADAQAVILERQATVDVDKEDADIIAEFFEKELDRLGYSLAAGKVFIPASVAAHWLEVATNEKRSANAAGRIIGQFVDEKRLPRFQRPSGNSYGRGILFVGDEAKPGTLFATDLKFDHDKKMASRG
jgi:hypothetical protein